MTLVAAYFGSALLSLVAAAVAIVRAAPELAAGWFDAPRVLLAVHLLALGFLPAAVAGAAFHVLPVLLRNGQPRRIAWLALPATWGGPALAYGVAQHDDAITWAASAAVGVALVLVLVEVSRMIVRAPRGRMLLASRTGLSLSCLHAAAAAALGPVVFARGWRPFLGVPHERLVVVHLLLGLVGWLTLLILAVGRTLGPMLALAPSEPVRRLPVEELLLSAGLWLLVVGVGADVLALAAVGAAAILAALARFARILLRVGREHRLEAPEGPMLHFLLGIVLLVQAAVTGLLALAGAGDVVRLAESFVLALLLGWAAGVTLGHLGKLLALSAWTWWPPGPRPKQGDFYPRRLWVAESVALGAGVQLLVAATLAGSTTTARIGGALVLAAAATALAGFAWTLVAARRLRR